MFEEHVTFIWKKGEFTYAASLHTWKPRRETVRTLATIIAGLQPTAPAG